VWLALVIVVNSVISVGYYYGVVRQMFLVVEGPAGVPVAGERVCPAVSGVGLATAVLTVVIGLGFEHFLGWATAATAVLP